MARARRDGTPPAAPPLLALLVLSLVLLAGRASSLLVAPPPRALVRPAPGAAAPTATALRLRNSNRFGPGRYREGGNRFGPGGTRDGPGDDEGGREGREDDPAYRLARDLAARRGVRLANSTSSDGVTDMDEVTDMDLPGNGGRGGFATGSTGYKQYGYGGPKSGGGTSVRGGRSVGARKDRRSVGAGKDRFDNLYRSTLAAGERGGGRADQSAFRSTSSTSTTIGAQTGGRVESSSSNSRYSYPTPPRGGGVGAEDGRGEVERLSGRQWLGHGTSSFGVNTNTQSVGQSLNRPGMPVGSNVGRRDGEAPGSSGSWGRSPYPSSNSLSDLAGQKGRGAAGRGQGPPPAAGYGPMPGYGPYAPPMQQQPPPPMSLSEMAQRPQDAQPPPPPPMQPSMQRQPPMQQPPMQQPPVQRQPPVQSRAPIQRPSSPDYDLLSRNRDRYRASSESSSPPPPPGYGGMADALRGRNVYRGASGGENVRRGVSLRRAPGSVSLSQLAIQPNVEPVDRPNVPGYGRGGSPTGAGERPPRRTGGAGGSYEPPPFESVSQSDFRRPYAESGGRGSPPTREAGRPSDFGTSRAAEIGRGYAPQRPPPRQEYSPQQQYAPRGQGGQYTSPPPGQRYPPQGYQQPMPRQSSGGFDPAQPYYQDRHGLRSLADRPDRQQPPPYGEGGDSKSFRPFPFQRLSQADFRQPYQGGDAVGGAPSDGRGTPPPDFGRDDGPPRDGFDRMMADVPPGGVPPIFFAPPGGPARPDAGPSGGGLPREPGDRVPRDPFEERDKGREAGRERRPREPDINRRGQERRPNEPNREKRPREPSMGRRGQERRPNEPNLERRPREPDTGRRSEERRPVEPNTSRWGQEKRPAEPSREGRRPREPVLDRRERKPNEPSPVRRGTGGPSDGTYSMSFERSNGSRRERRPNEPTHRTRSMGSTSSAWSADDRRDDDGGVPLSRVERRVGRDDGPPPRGTSPGPGGVAGRAGDDMSYEEYRSYFDGSRG